jgi:TPR repeat protein
LIGQFERKKGRLVEQGLGATKNVNQAAKYYKLAAERGHGKSPLTYPGLFTGGDGIERNGILRHQRPI